MRPRVIDHSVQSKSTYPRDVAISQIEQPKPAYSAATQRGIWWRRVWAKVAERTGSQVRAMAAKAALCAIREEIGEYESIAWPSVIVEALAEELSRSEVYQALDDLSDDELIELDGNQHGPFVNSVLRTDEEDEWLSFRFGEPVAAK